MEGYGIRCCRPARSTEQCDTGHESNGVLDICHILAPGSTFGFAALFSAETTSKPRLQDTFFNLTCQTRGCLLLYSGTNGVVPTTPVNKMHVAIANSPRHGA